MYANGEGVPQDAVEAVAWFRQAAEQGHAGAQFNLGVVYASGGGVPQDAVEAYLWFTLAVTYADAEQREPFAEARDAEAERLTPEQRADLPRRTHEFWEAHSPESR
jgi:TPR repeat protein